MKYLITGGCGFLGSNLANAVIKRNDKVFIFDNLSRLGSTDNLKWLQENGCANFIHADTRSYNDVENAVRQIRPDVIFHLAGQVAMTTSIANPRLDFETNVIGSHNILEVARKYSPETIITYSSTNKVYGDLDWVEYIEDDTRYKTPDYPLGFDEKTTLDFRSPYGCSKGAADQYMLDYARIFGLRTIVFRHSSIFGGRQFSTYDQGWIGWFVQKALEATQNKGGEPYTISGTGKQVRDVLYESDLIACYFSAVKHIDKTRGQAFNIGGGVSNSLSLLELFEILEEELDVKLRYTQLPWRQSDQKVFISDIRKAERLFDWTPVVSHREGVCKMIDWVKKYV